MVITRTSIVLPLLRRRPLRTIVMATMLVAAIVLIAAVVDVAAAVFLHIFILLHVQGLVLVLVVMLLLRVVGRVVVVAWSGWGSLFAIAPLVVVTRRPPVLQRVNGVHGYSREVGESL